MYPWRKRRDASVGGGALSCVISFRTYQALHMVIRTTIRVVSVSGSRRESSHSGPLLHIVSTSGIGQSKAMACHSSRANGHLENAWNPSSRSIPHRGHMSVSSRWRENLLAQVASELDTTLQANTRGFRESWSSPASKQAHFSFLVRACCLYGILYTPMAVMFTRKFV